MRGRGREKKSESVVFFFFCKMPIPLFLLLEGSPLFLVGMWEDIRRREFLFVEETVGGESYEERVGAPSVSQFFA